jgi:serine/threonine-protein kinase RsbW
MQSLMLSSQIPVPLNNPITSDDTALVLIDSSAVGLTQFYHFMSMLKERWAIDERLYASIYISMTEGVTNAFDHGNKRIPSKTICIGAVRDSNYYSFTIEDDGEGFDPRTVPNPIEPENILKPNGRGLFIMRQLSDYMHFSLGGKRLKMLFYKK